MEKMVRQLKISYFRDKVRSCPDIRLGYKNTEKGRSRSSSISKILYGSKSTGAIQSAERN